ncbi:hypothetical protein B4N84_25120 [Flavobacterium sp. IR1]|nr:hypothetical protein B4N84_25120 [Flavobacterium sp. IR1]
MFLKIKSKFYLVILLVCEISFSQTNDTIVKKDSLEVNELKEIKISSKRNKAGVYELIIPKKILENETLNKTIKRVDFISVDNANALYFKGAKIKNIYYNNKLITPDEFAKLNIEDVRAVSIDLNSFNQTTGEIETAIKVTEKKKDTNNIKGAVDFSQGFLQKFNYYGLSLSNKQGQLSSRLLISNVVNETENTVHQNVNGVLNKIKNVRNLSQPFVVLQNIYDLNDKSSIYIKNRYSIVDEDIKSNFSDIKAINYNSIIRNYSLNAGYDRKFEKNYDLKLSLDYINFDNDLNSSVTDVNRVDFSKQNFNEITFSPYLKKKGNKYELINSFVLTHRKYESENTTSLNKIDQNIATYFFNLSLNISDKSSLVIGNRYQYEKNNKENQSNNYFLPNIMYSTKVDSLVDIEFNYKRKIVRPSLNAISGSTYLDNNGNEVDNPDFLKTQTDDLFSLDLYREFKKFNLNVSFNYNLSKDYLSTLYGFSNNILLNSGINVQDYREAFVRTSLAIPLIGETKLNVNYSFTKLNFKQNDNKINGTVNYCDISLSGAIFQNYLYSINSFYIDRYYDYNAFSKAKPDFSFSISKNYLNDKLNLNVEFRNLLNQESNRKINYAESSNYFYQLTKNQSRLLLVSLTYNFGKDFKMTRKVIQNSNSDMKLK